MSKEGERDLVHQLERKSRQEKRPFPPFVVDSSGIPEEEFVRGFSELFLLGIGHYAANRLRSVGIRTIRAFDETDDKTVLNIRYFGEGRVQEGRAKLRNFRDEVEALAQERRRTSPTQQPDDSPVVVINAIDWLNKHNLAWDGTPKTARMSEIERYIGADLGMFLHTKYSQEGLSMKDISDLIYTLSNNTLRVSQNALSRMMEKFGVKKKRAEKLALQQVKPLTQRVNSSEHPRKGRASKEQIEGVRSLLQKAQEAGVLSKLPPREKYVLTKRFEEETILSLASIAANLGVTRGRVSSLQTRAITRLMELLIKAQSSQKPR